MLPNNSNVLLAAEQAALHADRPVEVVPSDSLPAGLAAMVAFDGTRGAAENAEEMREAVGAVTTGELTIASRDVRLNGVSIRSGEWLGLVDGEPVAGGTSFDEVADAVVGRLLADAARRADAAHGRRRAAARRTARPARRGLSRRSRSRCRRAASRTTRFCSRPNRWDTEPVAEPIRIVIVEDNEVFREALELLLGLQPDVEIVASVGDGSDAVPALPRARARPRPDGLPAARPRRHPGDCCVRRECPEVVVVCLTASANEREVGELYEAGATACLMKDQELDEIVGAIRAAART